MADESDKELKLRVAKAIPSDVGHGRARVPFDNELNLKPGDIIEIEGERSTAAIVWRCRPEDANLGVIRIDGIIRKNASVSLGDRVTVRHFHGWCRDMLRAYHVPLPANAASADEWARGLVQRTIEGVDRGLIPRGQYGAVLIDEGHDFEPEWFRLVVQMVDPDTDSLLVLYDDAQAIYRRPAGLGFSFASVGIQAQGRTTILRLNYRNTWQILAVAQRFAEGLLEERGSGDDDRRG